MNAALWEPLVGEGLYQVEAWIPIEAGYTYARYQITHSGRASEVRLRQSNFGAEWITLGTYAFDGSTASVRSTDAAGLPGEQLAWSAMRWTTVTALLANIQSEGATTTINEPQVSGPEEFVVRFVGVGYRGDLLRVHAQGAGASAVNTAIWHVPLSPGEYSVEAFIPREHAEAEVPYTIKALTGDQTVTLKQRSYNDLWVKLGDFSFGSAGATITSTDAAGVKEEEIAWDALRFTAHAPPGGGTSGGGTGGGTPGGGGPGSGASTHGGGTGRVRVPAQKKRLLSFEPLRVRSGPGRFRRGPFDAYRLGAIHPSPATLTMHYRCRLCLFIRHPLRLRPGTQTPYTWTSHRTGEIASLFGRPFYRGTVLEVTVTQTLELPRHYIYRFPGAGKVGWRPG